MQIVKEYYVGKFKVVISFERAIRDHFILTISNIELRGKSTNFKPFGIYLNLGESLRHLYDEDLSEELDQFVYDNFTFIEGDGNINSIIIESLKVCSMFNEILTSVITLSELSSTEAIVLFTINSDCIYSGFSMNESSQKISIIEE